MSEENEYSSGEGWREVRKGVKTKVLQRDEGRNFELHLTVCEPNFVSPHHSHPDDEWVYVLKGSVSDHTGTYNKGDFFVNKKDSEHTAHIGPEGCTLLVYCSGFPY